MRTDNGVSMPVVSYSGCWHLLYTRPLCETLCDSVWYCVSLLTVTPRHTHERHLPHRPHTAPPPPILPPPLSLQGDWPEHGLTNYKDTKNKMSSSKNNLTVNRLRGRCLLEFIDWRYSQSCWYFRPSFVNCCPFNLLSGWTFIPPHCVNKYTVYTYTVC